MKFNIIITVIVMMVLTSCGESDYREVNTINSFNQAEGYKFICIDGIEYVKVYSAMSGHFKPDGSLHTCENEVNGFDPLLLKNGES